MLLPSGIRGVVLPRLSPKRSSDFGLLLFPRLPAAVQIPPDSRANTEGVWDLRWRCRAGEMSLSLSLSLPLPLSLQSCPMLLACGCKDEARVTQR